MIDLNGDGAETTNDSEDSSDSTPELEPPNNDFLEGVDQLVEDLGQIGKKAKRDSNSIDSIALGVMPAKQPSLIERAILFKRQELPFCCKFLLTRPYC